MRGSIGDQELSPVDQAIELIRSRGGRSTATRRIVLEALLRAGGDLHTADDLFAQIQADHPDFTESTLYRTLSLLEELGLVDHVHLGHGPSHWYVKSEDGSWYLTCTRCGAAIDAGGETFDQLAREITDRTGFVIDSGHFALTGVCAACRSRI